jgi:hypothetical protein
MLALVTDGSVKATAPGAAASHTLVTRHTLASTPVGRRCSLTGLAAASLTPAGTPIVAVHCARRGAVGILAASNGA